MKTIGRSCRDSGQATGQRETVGSQGGLVSRRGSSGGLASALWEDGLPGKRPRRRAGHLRECGGDLQAPLLPLRRGLALPPSPQLSLQPQGSPPRHPGMPHLPVYQAPHSPL